MGFCEEGKVESKRSEGYLTTRVPPGVCNGALVMCGAAFRVPAGLRRGFGLVWERAVTAEGVGVKGGGSDAVRGSLRLLLGV